MATQKPAISFTLQQLCYKLLPFIGTTLVFWILGGSFLFFYGKLDLQLFINQFHTPFQDIFFRYATTFGEPRTLIPILCITAFLVYRSHWKMILSLGFLTTLLGALSAGVLKYFVFSHMDRPVIILGREVLYLVEGVHISTLYSFPSGHTTTAFAFFTFLAFVFRQHKLMQVSCAIVAILVAYSRVYLSQHFVSDVLAGSVLGMLCFIVVYLVTLRFFKLHLQKNKQNPYSLFYYHENKTR